MDDLRQQQLKEEYLRVNLFCAIPLKLSIGNFLGKSFFVNIFLQSTTIVFNNFNTLNSDP